MREGVLTPPLACVLQVAQRKSRATEQQVEVLRQVAGLIRQVDEEVTSLPEGARTYESVGRM